MADWQTQRIAQTLSGPRDGKLTPQDEQGFQTFMAFNPNVRAWSNGFQNRFGEAPDLNSPNFNYREAFMQGNQPQYYAPDNSYHWDSRGKAPDHPTAWMNDFMQQYGVDPMAGMQSNSLTPEQSRVVNDQIRRDALADLLMRVR